MRSALALLLASSSCGPSRCGGAGEPVAPPSVEITAKPTKPTGPADAGADQRCLEIAYEDNTPATKALFEARDLQAGGETWVAVLEAFAHRHGQRIHELAEPPPGYPGFGAPFSIDLARGAGWFTLDAEGDAAVFCASDAALLDDVRRDWQRANHDGKELQRALAEAAAFGLE